ncbi:MAG: methyltransferase domain-containing protein [Rhodothermales bacterium]
MSQTERTDTQTVASPSVHLLRTLAAVPVESRVLDLGCGSGHHAEPLARLGFDLFACDADEAAVALARDRVAEVVGEAAARRVTPARPAALGYPDDFFDWVVAHGTYDTAESAAELKDMLGETRRVLKNGGWVFVAFRRALAGPDLTPETLTKLFAEAGLALAEDPADDHDGEPVLRAIFRKVDATTAV